MEYRRFGNTVALRLDAGDEICAAVLDVARKEKIRLASVTGIGGTDEIEVGVFNMRTKAYDRHTFTGTHEITALCGNVNTMQNEPYAHLHISLAGSDGSLSGGHLLRCVISLTAEIFLQVIDGSVDRVRREDLQINVWDFAQ